MKKLQLDAVERTESAQATRAHGQLPAVVYGHGIETISIAIDTKAFQKAYAEGGESSLINLTVKGEVLPVLVREVQVHRLRDEYLHVDLYKVRMDEKINAMVPLVFEGVSVAVKDMGGTLFRNIDEIEVEALPQNLPHDITVDISSLVDFDAIIRVEDLNIPKDVEVLIDKEEVVALVQAPRTEAELEALSTEITEDVTAVEGVKDKEPEEGAEGEAAPEGDKKDEKKE